MDWKAIIAIYICQKNPVRCKMPAGGVLLRGTLVPLFTDLTDDLGEIGNVCFIFKMKLLRDLMTWHKTMSCVNEYLPGCSDTLQAPKMCAVIQTSFLD